MKNLLTKYWWVLLVAIAVIVALYMMTKPPEATQGTTLIDTNGDKKGDTPFNPRPYTDVIHADVYSLTAPLWFRNTKPYEDLVALKNAEIIAVAQDWQDRYYKEKGETMLQAINDEVTIPNSVINPINARFRALNLS
jgi:hypothetical protein